jgi:lipopolysaccharide transport system permease protein
MQAHTLSISSYILTIARYRDLIAQLVRREFHIRFRGAILGTLWAIISPMITVLMYAFVFGIIFHSRWGDEEVPQSFLIIVLLGMCIHGVLAEALSRAPSAIVGQPGYVKKVVFPLEILPIVVTMNSAFNAIITLIIVLIAAIITNGWIPLTVLLLPIVILPYVVLITGIVLFVSSIGVYIRDMSQITGVVTTLALFLAPIFYPLSAVPEHYRFLLYLNPVTVIVENAREVTLYGHEPYWPALLIYTLVACVIFWLGYCWFQKSRNGFADVI